MIKQTLAIAKGSWAVLRQDKELMALPVIGAVVMVIVALGIGLPLISVLESLETTNTITGEPELSSGGLAIGFVGFLVGYYLLVLINQIFAGGVVHGAYTRMTGGDPTVMSSIQAAVSKTAQLLPWAVATGTVGLILDSLRDRGFIGKIIAGIISFAWKTATFLVLPILVIEGLGPKAAYHRSKELMAGTWGQSANATFGFIAIGFIASLPGIALGWLAASSGNIGLWVLTFLWIAGTSIVITTLNSVMRAALYLFVINRQVPADFQGADLAAAFR